MADIKLIVCVNHRLGANQKSCAGSGSRELIKIIRHRLAEMNLDIPVSEQVCLGHCDKGIAMRIAPGGPFYTEVTEQALDDILRELARFEPGA